MAGYIDRPKVAIDLAKDSFLVAKHADVITANTIGLEVIPIALSKDNIYFNFAAIAKSLKKANTVCNGQKPWIVILIFMWF
ncbi:MAG: hypothetical protein WCK67_12990 [bacterium]